MTITDSIKIANEFKQIFGVNLNSYIMPELKIIGLAVLDICKFDDYLKSIHKDYADNISMHDYIQSHYGENAVKLVEKLLDM